MFLEQSPWQDQRFLGATVSTRRPHRHENDNDLSIMENSCIIENEKCNFKY